MIGKFASVLREKIRKDMNDYTDDMAGGACTDFSEYQKLCGVIQGLALAERHLLDLVEKINKDDEIDEQSDNATGNNASGTNSATGRTKSRSPY
jgi:hypothetical protein